MGRAIEAMFYNAAVKGTHKALNDMGMIPPEAEGFQPVDQVRIAAGLDPIPAAGAVTDKADEGAPRGRKGRGA